MGTFGDFLQSLHLSRVTFCGSPLRHVAVVVPKLVAATPKIRCKFKNTCAAERRKTSSGYSWKFVADIENPLRSAFSFKPIADTFLQNYISFRRPVPRAPWTRSKFLKKPVFANPSFDINLFQLSLKSCCRLLWGIVKVVSKLKNNLRVTQVGMLVSSVGLPRFS